MFAGTLNAGREMAEVAWQNKCRQEDLAQRELENERRAIDDARRSVDEKAQQLKAISHQSALIAGFSMVVLVEIQIPENINGLLISFFVWTAALCVAFNLIAMLNATLTLVAILRYNVVKREVPFREFWVKYCESDFIFALKMFSYGVPTFMFVLGQIGWVILWSHEAWLYASTLMSIIAFCIVCFWFTHTNRKWSDFLFDSDAKLFNHGD